MFVGSGLPASDRCSHTARPESFEDVLPPLSFRTCVVTTVGRSVALLTHKPLLSCLQRAFTKEADY